VNQGHKERKVSADMDGCGVGRHELPLEQDVVMRPAEKIHVAIEAAQLGFSRSEAVVALMLNIGGIVDGIECSACVDRVTDRQDLIPGMTWAKSLRK
jgi:hypothetical protein